MPRFPNGVHARFVVTDLVSETTTWLDGLDLTADIAVTFLQPNTIDLSVRSNNRQANAIFGDGDPLLAQSNRLLYVLFDDTQDPATPWACRAAGIIMSPQDQADADVPTTHLVAYDPWQFLMGQPACDDAGVFPDSQGLNFFATRGGVIAATLLKNAIMNTTGSGFGAFIDAGTSYGGTIFWSGVIEDTPIIDFTVQQGQSVGDCWNQLLSAGQDPDGGPGGLDIILTPIYDPLNRPGYTHELSIYSLAGSEQPAAPMAWGEFVRTSTTADRQHDGTPGNFVNKAYDYAGQAGFPVGAVTNAASIAKYNSYWVTTSFPNQIFGAAVRAMAHQQITLGKQGKRTFTVNPDPMRAAAPLRDYNLGDRIPQLAPDALRVAATGMQRIQGIPISVDPDGVTRVNALLTSPDWRGSDGT